MGPVSRLYVDTNVFVRLLEQSDELSNLFLADMSDASPFLATSELTLAELLFGPFRDGNDRLVSQYDSWTQTNPYVEVWPIDRSVLWQAALLRSRYSGLKLPDAIHVSSAMRSGCSHILTFDKRISGQYELDHMWSGRRTGPIVVDIVRPEIPVIEQMIREASQ